jgi:orotidine-5'-phosphate decarboxylase
VAARESQVCLGLDPDPRRLWPDAAGAMGEGPPAARAAGAVAAHCRALIDAAGPACVAAKPQVACFERLGAPGWAALGAVCDHARAAGLLVIADGKRGDIDVTATAYGEAFFGGTETPWGHVPGLGADALTANPLLGADSLAPLLVAARARAGGLFVLVRTSNRGAADVQELPLVSGGDVAERLARLVDGLGRGSGAGEPATGESGAGAVAAGGSAEGGHADTPAADAPAPEAATGLSDVGAVVGATAPAALLRLRELMPRAPILLPGVGAQGGRVEDLAPAWLPGRAGGLITASRSVARAHEAAGGDPSAAARAEAERLRAVAWTLV